MRLLNIKTLSLKSFLDPKSAPPYAILSHTWTIDKGEREVLFEDWGHELQQELRAEMESGKANTHNTPALKKEEPAPVELPTGPPERKMAVAKIIGFCKQSLLYGFDYGWVDTLCVDSRVRLLHGSRILYLYHRCATLTHH